MEKRKIKVEVTVEVRNFMDHYSVCYRRLNNSYCELKKFGFKWQRGAVVMHRAENAAIKWRSENYPTGTIEVED